MTRFWLGELRVRDNLEDPGVDGRIILRLILKKQDGGMGWIDLAQDRDYWVCCRCGSRNFVFHKIRSISCSSEDMVASQKFDVLVKVYP